MDRSRANLIARAGRRYVEREYASLTAVREAERELDEGKEISNVQVNASSPEAPSRVVSPFDQQ